MFSGIKVFIGALALVGVSGVMACDCGTKGTGTTRVSEATTVFGQSSEFRTQRSPAADASYSSSAGRGVVYDSSGIQRASAEDRSYPRRSARGVSNESFSGDTNYSSSGNGNGRGRKENLR